jgi:orotidine-5'-phosphate decarboxylase
VPQTSLLPNPSESTITEKTVDARDRLIVALDLADIATAKKIIAELGETVRFYKIGLSLQLAPGVNELIDELIRAGKKVFVDYKYYDTPETLEKAVRRAAQLGISFLTIHGTRNCIQAAVRARGSSNLKLFTVTVLTSMDIEDVHEMGLSDSSVEDLVLRRSLIAWQNGCDGVIASGQEVREIKKLIACNMTGSENRGLLVTTPGIRPEGSPPDDQKRRTTPAQAVLEGADFLVIGRPITEPADVTPQRAAQRIVNDMQKAFNQVAVERSQAV